MRLFVAILAIIAIAFAGTAMAADVPQDTLNQMGIHNMQKVSDAQGEQIRAMGGAPALPQLDSAYHLLSRVKFEQQNIEYQDGLNSNSYNAPSNQTNYLSATGAGDLIGGDMKQLNSVASQFSQVHTLVQSNSSVAIDTAADSVALSVDVQQSNLAGTVKFKWNGDIKSVTPGIVGSGVKDPGLFQMNRADIQMDGGSAAALQQNVFSSTWSTPGGYQSNISIIR